MTTNPPMIVSIRTGVFLEPVSQIVAKEVVGAVEMDDSMEKRRSIAEVITIAEAKWVAQTGQFGDSVPMSELRDYADSLLVTEGIP